MLVTIFHNIASDPQGRSLANFYGYSPGHPLVPVFRYNTELNMPDLIGDEAFRLFNVGDDPDFGPPDERAVAYRAAKNRSLSKGDVLLVGGAWLACASAGWDEVRRPTFLARNATQHGTTPLDDSNHLRDVTLADPKRELELTDPYTITAGRHEAALAQLDDALIGEPEAPAWVELPDGGVRIFEPDPEEGDRGRMYVLDVFGLDVQVREREGDLFVHIDREGTSAATEQRNLAVEVENGGENDYPDAYADHDEDEDEEKGSA